MKSELVPINGGAPIPVVKDVTIVGRRDFCDLVVADDSLSKRHAAIVRTDGLLMVRDLASTNGTKVNGQKIMWAALLPGDRLTLGRAKFKVYLGSDDAPSPSESRPPQKRPEEMPSLVATPILPSPRSLDRPPISLPGFAPPTPLGMPVMPEPRTSGSTDPDAEVEEFDELPIDDEDEQFVIDLE